MTHANIVAEHSWFGRVLDIARDFEELDYCYTLIGKLNLRRRKYPSFDTDGFEVKPEDEFLMSSLSTASLTTMGIGAANAGQLSLTAAAATHRCLLDAVAEALTPVDVLEMEAAE